MTRTSTKRKNANTALGAFMKRLFGPMLIGLLLCATGCGSVFIGGAIQTGSTARGSVSSVQIGNVVNGMGGTVQVTFVTFTQSGTFSTIGFCDDHISQFPLNQTVSVNFNPGQFCATIIVLVIV
jgi:hypothetical protein